MDVDRTNSFSHREKLTVNFSQEFCADCYAIEARFAAIVDLFPISDGLIIEPSN